MLDLTKVTLTATRQVIKYADGADPSIDAPFEILNHEEVLTGQTAIDYLRSQGPDGNAMADNILNGGA